METKNPIDHMKSIRMELEAALASANNSLKAHNELMSSIGKKMCADDPDTVNKVGLMLTVSSLNVLIEQNHITHAQQNLVAYLLSKNPLIRGEAQ